MRINYMVLVDSRFTQPLFLSRSTCMVDALRITEPCLPLNIIFYIKKNEYSFDLHVLGPHELHELNYKITLDRQLMPHEIGIIHGLWLIQSFY